MKRISRIVALAVASLGMQLAGAQGMKGMDMKDGPSRQSAAAGTHKATGTVKKADASRGKVTFDHEPVASMKWPAMTMEFDVADRKMLDNLKPGTRVQFEFTEKDRRRYVVTDIKR